MGAAHLPSTQLPLKQSRASLQLSPTLRRAWQVLSTVEHSSPGLQPMLLSQVLPTSGSAEHTPSFPAGARVVTLARASLQY